MKRLLQWCSRHGITTRMVFWFSILVIVPYLILVGVVYLLFQNYTIDSLGETTMDTMTMVEENLSAAFQQIEENSMSLYYDGSVALLEQGNVNETERSQLEGALSAACFSDTRIRAAYLVTEDEILHGGGYYPELLVAMEQYQEKIAAAGGSCLWYPTQQLHGRASEPNYVMARSLNGAAKKKIGILYLVLTDSIVTDAYDHLTSDYSTRFLTDSSGKVFYASDGTAFGEKLNLDSVDTHQRRGYQKVKGAESRDTILVTQKLMRMGWYCVSVIDMDEVTGNVFHLGLPFLVISLIYISFLFVMLHIMRHYVFRPLGTLTDTMDQYAQGKLETVEMKRVGIGEFQSLSEHFNHMTQRINKLMQDYKEEQDEKNRQKIKTMAAQLTPHFIYNALNTIKWVAVLNHQENIQHLVESLVNIFMNAARADDENYTVRDELELIRNYAVIQRVRFMNFDLVIDAEEQCLDCHIRKLLIQPIVENAIVHGMNRGKVRDGTVVVRVWLDDCLRITVADQGVGFDVEAWRRKPKKDDSHTNIGVHHVEEIIRMEYGAPYGIQIDSAPGQGTTVTYTLPAKPVRQMERTAMERVQKGAAG